MTLTADLCEFCNGHWLDYASAAKRGHCYALRENMFGELIPFHASPYFAHKYKGILTGEPLGMAEFIDRLRSEAVKVGV